MKRNERIGSSLGDFLQDQAILSEVEEMASCKFLAIQLSERLQSEGITVTEFARRMGTSRAAAKRVLNPSNTSLTFRTAGKAASALGMKISLTLTEV